MASKIEGNLGQGVSIELLRFSFPLCCGYEGMPAKPSFHFDGDAPAFVQFLLDIILSLSNKKKKNYKKKKKKNQTAIIIYYLYVLLELPQITYKYLNYKSSKF